MADRDLRTVAAGGSPASWQNHYSPKYNKCFVTASYSAWDKTLKGGPSLFTYLLDAFERSQVAVSATGVSAEFLCRNEEQPAECERGARVLWELFCKIEDQTTDCPKSEQFIKEHMKD
jgi:hypothetical protein